MICFYFHKQKQKCSKPKKNLTKVLEKETDKSGFSSLELNLESIIEGQKITPLKSVIDASSKLQQCMRKNYEVNDSGT